MARKLYELLAQIRLLKIGDRDLRPFFESEIFSGLTAVEAMVERHKAVLTEYGLREITTSAVENARQYVKTAETEAAYDALVDVTRSLLEISGQNDSWAKYFGYSKKSPDG